MGYDDDTHIYEINVDGLSILEYYGFNQDYSTEDVKEMWLDHGTTKLGLGIMAIKDRVEVTKIKDGEQKGVVMDGRILV